MLSRYSVSFCSMSSSRWAYILGKDKFSMQLNGEIVGEFCKPGDMMQGLGSD